MAFGARNFNGSSDAITTAINLSAYNKLTITFWLKWTTFANDDDLALEYSVNAFSNIGTFFIDPNESSTGKFQAAIKNGVGEVTSAEFTRPSAGVFHQYVFNFDGTVTGASQIPKIYLDGVSQTLSNAVTTGTVMSFGNFNMYTMSRAATSLFGAGSMSDLAIWGGVLLTDGEASALAAGERPFNIRPASLTGYWPLDGIQSPEPDLSGRANNGTLTGTANAAGPPITLFTPRRPIFPTPPPSVTFTLMGQAML